MSCVFLYFGVIIHESSSLYSFPHRTMKYTDFVCLRVWLTPKASPPLSCLSLSLRQRPVCRVSSGIPLSGDCLCFSCLFWTCPRALSPSPRQKMSILKSHFRIYLIRFTVNMNPFEGYSLLQYPFTFKDPGWLYLIQSCSIEYRGPNNVSLLS